jgi:hypothetical protein
LAVIGYHGFGELLLQTTVATLVYVIKCTYRGQCGAGFAEQVPVHSLLLCCTKGFSISPLNEIVDQDGFFACIHYQVRSQSLLLDKPRISL